VLASHGSVPDNASFLVLEYFFFLCGLFASSLCLEDEATGDLVLIPETPLAGRLACLTQLSACTTVWLFMGDATRAFTFTCAI